MAVFRLTDPPPGDQELIDRTLAGDGDAFAVLVERFQRKIFRLAFSIVRDESEADVVAQDTFVQAYTHLKRFEGRSGFETWLTRIAINRSRDSLRRRRFVSLFSITEDGVEEPLIEPVDERPDAERTAMSSQLRAAIRRAQRTLSAQQKLIFRLRHDEDLPAEAIAEHLGLKASTVRAHLFRASQKIRRELAAWREGTRK
ncbi:MAG TPA: sigma-70 family RNA polymerase sigma factor [Thermoanaerobaculia bacterium]|nr:sigma-70 family RNA polymerase sigma factor [Thermoanaerobaculia bacterium]